MEAVNGEHAGAEKSVENGTYFTSYEDLEVHRIMLSDARRNLAYKKAIENNKSYFEGKVILDVGAGTGLLSILCAQVSAKTVYAVEASKSMIPVLKESCARNNVENIVKVVEGEVESVELPEKVDVIVSEWMGFHLLHEGMLSSVIYARDKFLKPDGILVPDRCKINACLCRVPKLFDFWENVDGVNLSHVGALYRKKYDKEPAILELEGSDIASNLQSIVDLDLNSVKDEDLESISQNIIAVPKETGIVHGVCLSFQVWMFEEEFSTSPALPQTHWKQTVLVFPQPENVEAGEGRAFSVTFTRTSPRRYSIEVCPMDEEDVEHPIGCECSMARCRIICAYMKQQDEQEDEDEIESVNCGNDGD